MAETRNNRYADDDVRSERRLFLLRLVFLSLGIWSLCTLFCGIILSAFCLQKGQTSYSILAVVLTSLGMTGIITSLPCCLYVCLFHPRPTSNSVSGSSTPDSPSLVSDLFLQLSSNNSTPGREELGRRSPFSGSYILGLFRPFSRSLSSRQNSATNLPPPPYDPPPCYEDALRTFSSGTPQHLLTPNNQ